MSNISELLTGNPLHEEILITAGNLASKENLPAYVVGGYVRDTLLGRSSSDIDIMVEGDGIIFAKKLAAELKVKITVDYEKSIKTDNLDKEILEICKNLNLDVILL